ncbi:VasL domain-containing protein [Providencia sp. PROV164]|uniref:VasL domain-containing protein n=1 Tax=Providencia sp. PROV164 TaxID=2949871 RepID=UPI00234AA3B6|nr:VasL domain-containing protein [Providencia sp. PROV164]
MNPDLNTLRLGGDPRTLADFAALKDELNKRFHPARPDVDWARAHGLCLSLFNQNGADLQTCAWFTLIRQHQNGIAGLNEGLSLLQHLLSHHWQGLWPQQTHARVEIIATLSQQLVTGLRAHAPIYADLPALYQTETKLSQIAQQLQTLELKHLTQLERLQNLLASQARQLESTDAPDSGFIPPTPPQLPKTSPSTFQARTAVPPISIKANATISTPAPTQPSYRKGICVGLALGIVLTGAICAGTLYALHPQINNHALAQVLPQLPEFTPNIAAIIEQQLQPNPTHSSRISAEKLNVIDNYLVELESISPIWAQQYGISMANYLTKHYGERQEITAFNDKWQQNMQINASSNDKLQQWSEGMTLLNNLSTRLDSLDGKPRSYITGSELKTIIFNARQHFNQGMPLEEELRQLEQLQAQGTVPESEYQRIDTHFKQLLNRYALIQQNK